MTGNRFCRCFPKVLKKPIQLFLLRSHLFLVRRLKKKLNHRFRLFLSLFLFSSSGCGAIFPSTPMSPCKNSLSRIEDSSSSLCCFSQTEGGITPIVPKFNLTKLHHKNGNSLVLLHYLTTPIAIGYNQNGTTGFQKSLI